MARNFQPATAVLLFVAVILVEFVVQARHCSPPCEPSERCVPSDPRERRSNNNMCVPQSCLTRARRGRCSTEVFHFDHTSMSCRKDHSGSCYGANRFGSREDCELSCIPWYRR